MIPVGLVRGGDDDLSDGRAAAAGFQQGPVPAIFVSNVEIGLRFAMPTIVCAARWITVLISYSPIALSSNT